MTTQWTDLYAILGVPPNATQVEIGRAYRSLLRQHHPDTRDPVDEFQGAQSDATLQEVLAAYTVLRNPARRADYDRQVRRRSRAAPQRPQNDHRTHDQPPIVAGPVRWHRA